MVLDAFRTFLCPTEDDKGLLFGGNVYSGENVLGGEQTLEVTSLNYAFREGLGEN